MTRKTSFSIPASLLEQVDAHVALLKQYDETMTRSKYICQALREKIAQVARNNKESHHKIKEGQTIQWNL